ncbi:MAG: hydantoinase B/oxoprolinase family protein [cyanobacterium endosymbiont of Rhopalodia inflata]
MSYLYYFSICSNSGGQRLYQGGNRVIRRLRFLESITATILSSYRIIPPFGLLGR